MITKIPIYNGKINKISSSSISIFFYSVNRCRTLCAESVLNLLKVWLKTVSNIDYSVNRCRTLCAESVLNVLEKFQLSMLK